MSSCAKHIAKPAPYFFNSAIWARSVREAAGLLLGLCAFMFAFAWVYVWLISRIELPALLQLLTAALKDFEKLSGVPFGEVATPEGRIALAFVDPLVHLTVIVWAISRGIRHRLRRTGTRDSGDGAGSTGKPAFDLCKQVAGRRGRTGADLRGAVVRDFGWYCSSSSTRPTACGRRCIFRQR